MFRRASALGNLLSLEEGGKSQYRFPGGRKCYITARMTRAVITDIRTVSYTKWASYTKLVIFQVEVGEICKYEGIQLLHR